MLLPPLCCLLLVLSLLWNPRTAWERPSGAARTLTRSRPPPAGPSERRHVKCRGRYPLQEPPCRPQELPRRRRDLCKTTPKTTATPGAMLFSAPQCTFYSSHPLRTPDLGGRRRLLPLPYVYSAPPCVYKRRRRALSSPSHSSSSSLALNTHAHAPRSTILALASII